MSTIADMLYSMRAVAKELQNRTIIITPPLLSYCRVVIIDYHYYCSYSVFPICFKNSNNKIFVNTLFFSLQHIQFES